MATFDVPSLLTSKTLAAGFIPSSPPLRYVLEAAAQHGKSVWVLDRPNQPAARLRTPACAQAGKSFVGAGAMPMRHGPTMGELGAWFIATLATQCRLSSHCHARLATGSRPLVTAGHSANGAGSTPAPTPPIFRWHAPMRARSCSKEQHFPKAGHDSPA